MGVGQRASRGRAQPRSARRPGRRRRRQGSSPARERECETAPCPICLERERERESPVGGGWMSRRDTRSPFPGPGSDARNASAKTSCRRALLSLPPLVLAVPRARACGSPCGSGVRLEHSNFALPRLSHRPTPPDSLALCALLFALRPPSWPLPPRPEADPARSTLESLPYASLPRIRAEGGRRRGHRRLWQDGTRRAVVLQRLCHGPLGCLAA